MKWFFDYSEGEYLRTVSDSMAEDSDGNRLIRLSDRMAMDMEKGEMHVISGWNRDDDD